ncbi:MAG: aminodeoxychorismate synthase component I [Alphaproteobacteria bacterium]|nr:aminodeoxychorismate synthase component I [Alphaproteobacteria bacterium]
MKSYVLELPYADPAPLFACLQQQSYALFLDSADRSHQDARYSFICAFPQETIEAKNGVITVRNAHGNDTYEGDPFAVLQDRLSAINLCADLQDDLPPFQGGAAGFFGYDLGRGIEEMPSIAADDPGMIDMAIGLYDQVMGFDHARRKRWLITHAVDETQAKSKQEHFLKALDAPAQKTSFSAVEWQSNFSRSAYEQAVQTIINYIEAGDIFQANLSQRFEAQLPDAFCAYAHYLNMRRTNPAPFAGFMNLDDIKIASASPERFLRLEGARVETRPIKGTAPRSADAAQDEESKAQLENSAKDRAENTMIVDLLRNDLSKSCEAPSIIVQDLCKLESFARVHHLVSTVTGTLRADQSAIDLLRGCFPGGSITGAPKIRAMEIIEELEPMRRGPYCGAMGYITPGGSMDTNILIRTLVYNKGRVSVSAGGGIVYDSDPASEYEETLDKARAIFESFSQEKTEDIAA